MQIQEILEEWKEDAIIDDSKVQDEIYKVSSLHSKYLNYFLYFKQQLSMAESKRAKTGFTIKKYYRGELTREELDKAGLKQYQGLKMSNTEIQSQFELDPTMVDLKKIIDDNKIAVQCIEYIMNSIKSRDFTLKNAVEYQKFLAGV